MPRTGERGGPETRRRISGIATRLFLERGFDEVTVAEVAKAAGVSSVTVFKHFPRKEDLLLDRSVDAHELLRAAVRGRPPGIDVLTSLQETADGLTGARHALSGVDPRAVPFFRTVAASPALIARSREIASELQQTLATELENDPAFEGDATLLAAFFLAGYAAAFIETVRTVMAGEPHEVVVATRQARMEALFVALRHGVGPS
ncbi:TetR/AcrR family transcriptional regulator [Cryptosporangium sp. NPDC051539]|uniref:TetR/AcrR family transcriptional regulator n=1 Tax=Cryptosporangium sp. NPDC051539 TaxID=3363962 RepID=UPI00378914DB